MGDNDIGCPNPECNAGRILNEIKESNKDYREEIRMQLENINTAVKGLTAVLTEYIKNNALVEQAVMYLREAETRNEKAHDILFKKVDELENKIILKTDAIKEQGAKWLWEALKLLWVASIGGMIAKFFL